MRKATMENNEQAALAAKSKEQTTGQPATGRDIALEQNSFPALWDSSPAIRGPFPATRDSFGRTAANENATDGNTRAKDERDAPGGKSDRASATLQARTVVFSHRTALQIARIVQLERYVRNRKPCVLPDAVPNYQDVEDSFHAFKDECRGLEVSQPLHYLVSSHTRRRATRRFSPHSCATPLPGKSVHHLTRRTFCAAPVLAYAQLAAEAKSQTNVLLLGWELCGTYRTLLTSRGNEYEVKPLCSVQSIASFVNRNPGFRGVKALRMALPYLADNSASPRETKLALLLCLPQRVGGYGLGVPKMNLKTEASDTARRMTGKSHFKLDLCWPESRMDVEYQSREMHSNEASRIEDSRRANALESMKWNVIGVTNGELDDPYAMDGIAKRIKTAMGRTVRKESPKTIARRAQLRRELGLPS